MTFLNPSGAWILLFVLLFAVLIRLSLRFRRRSTPAFFLLAGVVDSLPLLSSSFLRRRRFRLFLLLAGVAAICFSALLPVLGTERVEPVNMVLVIDHLSRRLDAEGNDLGWPAVVAAAREVMDELNGRDRVMVVLSDRGPVTKGFESARAAGRALRHTLPSDLPARPEENRLLLASLGSLGPELGFIVTPHPEVWAESTSGATYPWRIIPAAVASARLNVALLDVDIQPDLLRRSSYSIFCRVAAFAPPSTGTIPVRLSILLDDETVREEDFLLAPGEAAVFVTENLILRGGLLSLRLSPEDGFMQDNVFRTPLRDRPFHRIDLYTAGSVALEASLESMGTISLRTLDPEEDIPPDPAPVTVYDGHAPDEVRGSSLFVGPFSVPAGISQRGESFYPTGIDYERHNPLLEGVSFANLRLGRIPVIVPPPSMKVLARADGSPLVVAGRTPSGHRMALLAFDPVETGWMYEPDFPILIANLISWLSLDTRSAGSSFAVGDTAHRELFSSGGVLTGPDGNSIDLDTSPAGAFTFARAGVYSYGGPKGTGSVFVNLLDEHVSGLAVRDTAPAPPLPFPDRPYSQPLQAPLLVLGLLLLALEPLVAPRARAGRLP